MIDTDSEEARREFYFLRWNDRFRVIQRELVQRYRVQQIAVGMGVSVFVFMAYILFHHLFCKPLLPPEHHFSWVLVVAPITSITIITVALFVAAFRRFEDKDSSKVRDGVSLGANVAGQGDV